jgi:hypothetical protein
LLKPEQASTLTLAENLGEISLIPRNPDDEESNADAEVSVDKLFAESEKGSREKEQGIDEGSKSSASDTSALLSAVQAVPPKPPFVMEIVEAQTVRTMDFDADTGKPIRDPGASAGGPTVYVPPTTGGTPAGAGDGTDVPTAAPEEMLDDFPIDFGGAP